MPDKMSVVINALAKPGVDPAVNQYLTGSCVPEIEIYLLSSNPKPSILVYKKLTNGMSISINEPVIMDFKNLQKLIEDRTSIKISENKVLSRFLNATSVSCNAFYYQKETDPKENDPKKKEKITFLIEFALEFQEDEKGKGGLISALTDCPEIANLFDVRGVSVSLVQCRAEDRNVLQTYAAQLLATGKTAAILPNPEKNTDEKITDNTQGSKQTEAAK